MRTIHHGPVVWHDVMVRVNEWFTFTVQYYDYSVSGVLCVSTDSKNDSVPIILSQSDERRHVRNQHSASSSWSVRFSGIRREVNNDNTKKKKKEKIKELNTTRPDHRRFGTAVFAENATCPPEDRKTFPTLLCVQLSYSPDGRHTYGRAGCNASRDIITGRAELT